MGGLADPCAFSTKPTHPPRSSNTQNRPGLILIFYLDKMEEFLLRAGGESPRRASHQQS